MQPQRIVGPLVRRAPGYNPALLSSPEQFLHIPLAPESVYDPAAAPDMTIGTQHAPAQARTLQQTPPFRIDVPMERYLSTALVHRCDHQFREPPALPLPPTPPLQPPPGAAPARRPPLQFAE